MAERNTGHGPSSAQEASSTTPSSEESEADTRLFIIETDLIIRQPYEYVLASDETIAEIERTLQAATEKSEILSEELGSSSGVSNYYLNTWVEVDVPVENALKKIMKKSLRAKSGDGWEIDKRIVRELVPESLQKRGEACLKEWRSIRGRISKASTSQRRYVLPPPPPPPPRTTPSRATSLEIIDQIATRPLKPRDSAPTVSVTASPFDSNREERLASLLKDFPL